MNRPFFLAWYYNEGVHDLLEIWKNYLIFFLRFFSIGNLLLTLFRPWKRDNAAATWRGLHPIKWINLFLNNLISRVIGAVVRLAVIAVGGFFLAACAGLGIVLLLFWIGAPLLLIFSAFFANSGYANFFIVGIIFLCWVISAIVSYLISTETYPNLANPRIIVEHEIFGRIAERFGLSVKHFPKEIFFNDDDRKEFLRLKGLSEDDFEKIVQWEIGRFLRQKQKEKFWLSSNLEKIRPIGAQWGYGYTVLLDQYSRDLTAYDDSEYAGAELVGRKDEYDILKIILGRPDQNCVLITGAAGIGKSTIIHHFAKEIREGKLGGIFESKRILLLDLGSAISDAVNQGIDVENRMRELFFEAAYAGNVILVIQHLEHFLGNSGNVFHPDISAVISEFLHIPSLQIIATSTQKEYHELIEKNDSVAKYFEVVEVLEPHEDDTLKIMLFSLEKYEYRRIIFSYKGLKAILKNSSRHNWSVPYPERALDLMMDVLVFWEKKSQASFVEEETVDEYISMKTGVPHGEILGEERKKLLNLEAILHRQVIGQNEAVRQVAQALRRARSGVGDSKHPVGSFLFLGPTGVGKTETAKALAKTYFGSEKQMIRLDMSEYQTSSSIDRLIGSSQLNKPGILTSKIKDNPYSLLLLDEIEKAYPEILDLFLQVLDEGFVTDAFGEKINFRNTIIIATSNAGAALIKGMIERDKASEDIKQAIIDYAVEHGIFRLEFLNRFEGVIYFRPLIGQELNGVVLLMLRKIARRISKEKNIEIAFDDSIVSKIIERGYNPIFGARSLRRYVEDALEDEIAKKIISGEVRSGEKIAITF